jgi:NAD(P)-dependent dehydrogenase (short-subunit alcohol dehydrogenase family)
MRHKRRGVIINISSAVALVPGFAYAGLYGASKHALNTATEALAMEVAAFGIRAICVDLGGFTTNIFSKVSTDVPSSNPYGDDQRWGIRYATSAGTGDPSDAAEAIANIAEDDTSPTHVLVGDDAKGLIKLARRSNTFEEWLPVITRIGESLVGPRPVSPDVPGSRQLDG